MRKLHLGAGAHILGGWMNTDGKAGLGIEQVVELTKPLPFPDAAFSHAFSEHVLEHLHREEGVRLLREVFRVVAPGGRVRTAVPDLEMFMRLAGDPAALTDDERAYLDLCRQYHGHRSGCETLNWLFQQGLAQGETYPHRYQYTEAELRAALETAGFVEVRRYPVGQSDDPELRSIEHESRLPAGMLAVETLVLEARKP